MIKVSPAFYLSRLAALADKPLMLSCRDATDGNNFGSIVVHPGDTAGTAMTLAETWKHDILLADPEIAEDGLPRVAGPNYSEDPILDVGILGKLTFTVVGGVPGYLLAGWLSDSGGLEERLTRSWYRNFKEELATHLPRLVEQGGLDGMTDLSKERLYLALITLSVGLGFSGPFSTYRTTPHILVRRDSAQAIANAFFGDDTETFARNPRISMPLSLWSKLVDPVGSSWISKASDKETRFRINISESTGSYLFGKDPGTCLVPLIVDEGSSDMVEFEGKPRYSVSKVSDVVQESRTCEVGSIATHLDLDDLGEFSRLHPLGRTMTPRTSGEMVVRDQLTGHKHSAATLAFGRGICALIKGNDDFTPGSFRAFQSDAIGVDDAVALATEATRGLTLDLLRAAMQAVAATVAPVIMSKFQPSEEGDVNVFRDALTNHYEQVIVGDFDSHVHPSCGIHDAIDGLGFATADRPLEAEIIAVPSEGESVRHRLALQTSAALTVTYPGHTFAPTVKTQKIMYYQTRLPDEMMLLTTRRADPFRRFDFDAKSSAYIGPKDTTSADRTVVSPLAVPVSMDVASVEAILEGVRLMADGSMAESQVSSDLLKAYKESGFNPPISNRFGGRSDQANTNTADVGSPVLPRREGFLALCVRNGAIVSPASWAGVGKGYINGKCWR